MELEVEAQAEDEPDWLLGLVQAEAEAEVEEGETEQAPVAEAETEGEPDWLSDLRQAETEDEPDWLMGSTQAEAEAGEIETEAEILEEQLSDTDQETAEALPIGAGLIAGTAAAGLVAAQAEDEAGSDLEEAIPAWLANLPPAEAEAVQEADLADETVPEWTEELPPEQPAEVPTEDEPAWMAGLRIGREGYSVAEATVEAPAEEPSTPEASPTTEEDFGTPEWIVTALQTSETEATEVQPTADRPDEPDWLAVEEQATEEPTFVSKTEP
jgi:hypothetical protein